MKEYHVSWEIDITAETPQQAAITARHYQLDPDSTADIFNVTDPTTNITETIDLQEATEL